MTKITKEQLERVRAIINADCKIDSWYVLDNGDTCAIGALALAAGVDKEFLFGSVNRARIHNLSWLVKKLTDHYGLTSAELSAIQMLNDSNLCPEKRREAILGHLAYCHIHLSKNG